MTLNKQKIGKNMTNNLQISQTPLAISAAKAEKPIYTYDWTKVHQKSFALETQIKAVIIEQPNLKSAGLDAIGFIESYYEAGTPRSLDAHFYMKGSTLGFLIKSGLDNKAVGNIEFTGDGHWKYEITASKVKSEDEEIRGKISYNFKGRADRWSVEDMPDDTPYLFSFYGEAAKLFDLPETFSKNYEPMLSLRGTQSRMHTPMIEWKWITSFYDGPIAGYCLYGGKLHAYQQTEEKNFSRQRLYAVYALHPVEKLCIYLEKGLSVSILKVLKWEMWRKVWYSYASKIFKHSPKWWKKTKPIGYFSY